MPNNNISIHLKPTTDTPIPALDKRYRTEIFSLPLHSDWPWELPIFLSSG